MSEGDYLYNPMIDPQVLIIGFSVAKLARPTFHNRTPQGGPAVIRAASEVSSSSDDDSFVPNGRTATKTNVSDLEYKSRANEPDHFSGANHSLRLSILVAEGAAEVVGVVAPVDEAAPQ